MSNSPSTIPATKTPKTRRSQSADGDLLRAKAILAALPPLLDGIAAKDANAAKVRIDEAWVTSYANAISAAQDATAGGAVAKVTQKAATAAEHAKALELSLVLTDVRDLVATHNPDDLAAQQAYGRGEKIDPRRTPILVDIAGSYLAAWDGTWKQPAVDAGILQATMTKIQTLRDALAAADVAQHAVIVANEGQTTNRAGALALVRQMSTFATKVVQNVFGRTSDELQSLSDPRPPQGRDRAGKAATKAKHATAKAAKKSKKAAVLAKPGARAAAAKGRAKLAKVKAKTQTLAAKVKASPKTKAKAAKTAAKRPEKKAKRAK